MGDFSGADTLGKRLKLIRHIRAIEQRDFAAMLGVSVTYLSKLENDRIDPRVSLLVRIADILRVTPNHLFGVQGLGDLFTGDTHG